MNSSPTDAPERTQAADGETRSEATATFVVAANRLPVDRVTLPDGTVSWRTSPGGLVTALIPVMRAQQGAWVGWHGAPDESLEPFEDDGLQLVPVTLSTQELAEYYEGMSNATLWPLYHDSVAFPEFHREWWDSYVDVNQRFTRQIADIAAEGAIVWVQDYQLQLVPSLLREIRPDLRIGFFNHIPFPPVELFNQLPWRDQILQGLLGADIIGFQTPAGAANFRQAVKLRLRYDSKSGQINLPGGRRATAKAYPISIDAKDFQELAQQPEVQQRAAEIRAELGNPRWLFLGIDRLDYTKGIKQRLRAFGELVAEGKLDPDEVVFLQVATPSRERVEEYRLLRDEIDRLVGRINGDLGKIGVQPLTYLHSSYPRDEMAAMYTAADIMVVTPLRDGMNLVAKEFIACRSENDGALILSEFAGAAQELKQSYLINPYDINGMKARMLEAVSDDPKERSRRMKALRKQVFTNDIDHWASDFLADLRP